jgi:hypothetical protein
MFTKARRALRGYTAVIELLVDTFGAAARSQRRRASGMPGDATVCVRDSSVY